MPIRHLKQNPKRRPKPSIVNKNTASAKKKNSDLIIDLTPSPNQSWIGEQVRRNFQHKKKTPQPHDLKPMLASVVDQPFDDADWSFEIKWDGYRTLAYVGKGEVELRSRNNKSFNAAYQKVVRALATWDIDAVLDGEIVVLSESGHSDFEALQNYTQDKEGLLRYYVFDLLWINGVDLRNEPLHVRRSVLEKIIGARNDGTICYSDSIEQYGTPFFQLAKENGLEGIIAKHKQSHYSDGKRTTDWLKIKLEKRHEAIICGYTLKTGSDRLFSSLLLGVPGDDDIIKFIGQVGTGFTEEVQTILLKKLKRIQTNSCPFTPAPPIKDPVQWVKPQLVCEVKYTELTKSGVMRHPSFLGLRADKQLKDINPEEAQNKDALLPHDLGGKETATIVVDTISLSLTNLTKPYWRKEGITKGDLINYYHAIAPYLLPYLQNRPQSLNRFPNGIEGKSFYQKDMKGKVPKWIKTFERVSASSNEAKEFMICDGEASLLYMVNLGCIELNPWHSRVANPRFPDWCVIDLDPGAISFDKVIETALVVREVLDALSIPSFPKTSGATGIHIYIPLGGKYQYDQSRQLAELIAILVHQQLPDITSLERSPAKRKDKIYIDYLQNRPIQTICAPYSVRPQKGATVSAPLHWSEVKKGLSISSFTMKTMHERVIAEGDLFEGVLGAGINLNSVLQQLARTLD